MVKKEYQGGEEGEMGAFTLNIKLAVKVIKQYNTSGLIFSLVIEGWSNS